MKEFGVEKDLEVYKSLIDIMPKDVYIPENRIQSGFYHYPKQQECLLDVLVQMSENKVTPDRETGDLILSITGLDSAPMRYVFFLIQFYFSYRYILWTGLL